MLNRKDPDFWKKRLDTRSRHGRNANYDVWFGRSTRPFDDATTYVRNGRFVFEVRPTFEEMDAGKVIATAGKDKLASLRSVKSFPNQYYRSFRNSVEKERAIIPAWKVDEAIGAALDEVFAKNTSVTVRVRVQGGKVSSFIWKPHGSKFAFLSGSDRSQRYSVAFGEARHLISSGFLFRGRSLSESASEWFKAALADMAPELQNARFVSAAFDKDALARIRKAFIPFEKYAILVGETTVKAVDTEDYPANFDDVPNDGNKRTGFELNALVGKLKARFGTPGYARDDAWYRRKYVRKWKMDGKRAISTFLKTGEDETAVISSRPRY